MNNFLVHAVNGDDIGAYVYKDNIQNGIVQPVTLKKDNIHKYLGKLLTELPVQYKGKLPIGTMSAKGDLQLNNTPQQESKDIKESEEGSGGFKKLYPRDVPQNIAYNSAATPEDLDVLSKSIPSVSYYNTLAPIYKKHVADITKRITGDETNVDDLKKIINLVNIAQNQWGPKWSHQLHSSLRKKADKVQPQSTQEPAVQKPVAAKTPDTSRTIGQVPFATTQPAETKPKVAGDTHYHYDNSKIDFDPRHLNDTLAKLDNESPHAIIYKIPELHGELQQTFGPNWATLISVAQRLNRYKAKGFPNAVDKVKSEYKNALITAFGKDWEHNFSKIEKALTQDTMATQLDPSLDKKDNKVDSTAFSYSVGSTIHNPSIRYLKDIAVPSLLDYSDMYLNNLDSRNPNLANDLVTNLGPYWKDLVSMGKKALQQQSRGQNPFSDFLNGISQNQELHGSLQNKFGQDYVGKALHVISAIVGKEIPENIKNSLADYQNPQVGATAGPQQGQDPSQAQVAASNPQGEPEAQPQVDPSAEQQPQVDPNSDPNAKATPDAAQQQPDQGISIDNIINQPSDEEQQAAQNPEIEMPKPVEGEGDLPQSKDHMNSAANLADNVPTLEMPAISHPLDSVIPQAKPDANGNFSFIKNGVKTMLNVDKIKKALAIEIFANNKDEEKEAAVKELLGPSWQSLHGHIHDALNLIVRGKDPVKEWERQYKSQKMQKKLEIRLGLDWKTVLGVIASQVTDVVNSLKQG